MLGVEVQRESSLQAAVVMLRWVGAGVVGPCITRDLGMATGKVVMVMNSTD